MKIQKSTVLIILGAGAPKNSINPIGLQKHIQFSKNIENQLELANQLEADLFYVTGFEFGKLKKSHPKINFIFNEFWKEQFTTGSLQIALNKIKTISNYKIIYVMYGDVYHSLKTCNELLLDHNIDISFAISKENFTLRSEMRPLEKISYIPEQNEFTGLMAFRSSVLQKVKNFVDIEIVNNSFSSLSNLIDNHLTNSEYFAWNFSIVKNWAHLEHSRSIQNYLFDTKVNNLEKIYNRISSAKILPLYKITKKNWDQNPIAEFNSLYNFFGNKKLIVRSSAKNEDSLSQSNAGRYATKINIAMNFDEISVAIEEVFESYIECDSDDVVFIQEFMSNLSLVGVAFTRINENAAPYRQIEISRSNNSSVVTAGLEGTREIWKIYKFSDQLEIANVPDEIVRINEMLMELELFFGYQFLDIEFAMRLNFELLLFQVRPLVIPDEQLDMSSDMIIDSSIRRTQNLISKGLKTNEELVSETIYSNMADWNPAEIIGRNPTKLALDLYEYCITDKTWAVQRSNNGYKRVKSTKLLKTINGKAYVDVYKSIKSFIPSTTSDYVTKLLISGALNKLKLNLELHDKIEFEIIPTCIDFSVQNWLNKFDYLEKLSKQELQIYKNSLLEITKYSINFCRNNNSQVLSDNFLNSSRQINNLNNKKHDNILLKSYLNRIRNKSALDFANSARLGFIAISLLQSTIDRDILSKDRIDLFMTTIFSISSQMLEDAFLVKKGKIKYEVFESKYGHLRPGTYDISTRNYSQDADFYLKPLIENAKELKAEYFELTTMEKYKLDKNLCSVGLNISSSEFFNFVRTAITARELSKFDYSRSISFYLDSILSWGENYGLTSEDLKFLNLKSFVNSSEWNLEEKSKLRYEIDRNRNNFQNNLKIELPDVISNQTNIFATKLSGNSPSFPTSITTRGSILLVKKNLHVNSQNFEGLIVAIESADPGYDFILGNSIAGLITAYGGPNSHMAIRCSELRIPAVIGVGMEEFRKLQNDQIVEIDSLNKVWRVIRK
jgi:phosphohistidine swiveling domain-containing protein